MITTITLSNAGVVRVDDLRYLDSGKAVLNVTIAESDSKFDRAADEWVTQSQAFIDVTFWGDWAEQAAVDLEKGTQVKVTGKLATSTWQDKTTGENRSKLAMTGFDYAVRPRVDRGGGQAGFGAQSGRQSWQTSQPQSAGHPAGRAGGTDGDEPPF